MLGDYIDMVIYYSCVVAYKRKTKISTIPSLIITLTFPPQFPFQSFNTAQSRIDRNLLHIEFGPWYPLSPA
jgi:hypothetical protein